MDFGVSEIAVMMAALSAATAVAGGVSSANIAKQNELNAEADRETVLDQGRAEADRQRAIVRAKQGELAATTGASNTAMTGSPMEIYLANAKQGEMEVLDKLNAAGLQARGLKAAAKNYNRQATSSLIGGAGQAAGTLGSTLLGAYGPKPGTKPKPGAGTNEGVDLGDLY